jgi:hypothetical protein
VNASEAAPAWIGNYASFSGLRAGDVIRAEFAVPEETATFTLASATPKKYTCKFRGDTCVEVSGPGEDPVGYPLYSRDHLKKAEAPVKTVTRFVAPKLYSW